MTDQEIEQEISRFRAKIENWAENCFLCSPLIFYTFEEYFEEPPDENPTVLVIHIGESLYEAFSGQETGPYLEKVYDEFHELVTGDGYLYEFEDTQTVVITPDREDLCDALADYYDRKWLESTNLKLS